MTNLEHIIAQGQAEHGEAFDASNLAPQFLPYYRTMRRLRVRTTYPSGETFERTGWVGKTTGWRPVFLLMRRSDSISSWDTLGEADEIVAVQDPYTKQYRPVRAQ
jgi:hypothetical protein